MLEITASSLTEQTQIADWNFILGLTEEEATEVRDGMQQRRVIWAIVYRVLFGEWGCWVVCNVFSKEFLFVAKVEITHSKIWQGKWTCAFSCPWCFANKKKAGTCVCVCEREREKDKALFFSQIDGARKGGTGIQYWACRHAKELLFCCNCKEASGLVWVLLQNARPHHRKQIKVHNVLLQKHGWLSTQVGCFACLLTYLVFLLGIFMCSSHAEIPKPPSLPQP
jgi:hypothetical protein